MQVKQRLKISVVVSAIMTVVLLLVLSIAMSRVNRAMEASDIADELMASLFERSAFRADYLRTNSERARIQWFAKHEQIGGLLKVTSEKFSDAEGRKTKDELIKDHQATEKLFSAIVENRKKSGPDANFTALSQEIEDRLRTQLNMRLYDKILNIRKLHESARGDLFSALRFGGLSIFAAFVIILLITLINSWTIGRAITARVLRLRDGVLVIGRGNLDYQIDIKGDDEFAELSDSFNNEIEERKKAEEALRESEEQFRALADSIPNLAWWANPDGYLTWYNQRWYEYTGTTPEEMEGWGWQSVHDPDMLPKVLEQWKASISSGKLFEMEFPLRGADGIFRSFLTRGIPLKDSAGSVLRWFGTNTDISVLKEAEEALHKAYDELELRIEERTKELKDAEKSLREMNETLEQRVAERSAEVQAANASLRDSRTAALNLMRDAVDAHKRTEEAIVKLQQEVIARRRGEEALRKSEEGLQRAQEIAHLGSWELDLVNNSLFWSDETYRIFGLQPQKFGATYEAFLEVVHPDDRAAVNEAYSSSLREGRDSYEIEHRVVRKTTGEIRYVHEKCRHFHDETGRIIRSVGMVHDISERKQVEREREITVEFLYLVNSRAGTEDLIKDAAIFFQGQSGCEALGIRLKKGDDFPYCETRGFPEKFVLAENSLCVRDAAGDILRDTAGNIVLACMCGNIICGRFDPVKDFFSKGGSFWTNSTTELLASTTDDPQVRARNRCHGEGYESVALIPLRVGQEQLGLLQLNDRRKGMFARETVALWERLAGYLSIAIMKFRAEEDVLKLSEDMAARNLELEDVNKELESFIYSVSHDLRAPLRSMSSFSQFLMEDYFERLDDQAKDYLSRISRSSVKMSKLIEDLLNLSMLSRKELNRTKVDLSELAAFIVSGLREADPGRGVEVSIEDGVTAFTDPSLTEIVFFNLFGNAWKFTSKTAEARIEFGTIEKNGKTLYYVRDNGAGFDPQFAAKMFQPFHRLHSSEDFEGTGIGLAIVERIIRRHDGTVWAEGEVGKGATVYFSLG